MDNKEVVGGGSLKKTKEGRVPEIEELLKIEFSKKLKLVLEISYM